MSFRLRTKDIPARRPWTDKDEIALRAMRQVQPKMTRPRMAQALDRPLGTIDAQLYRMGREEQGLPTRRPTPAAPEASSLPRHPDVLESTAFIKAPTLAQKMSRR